MHHILFIHSLVARHIGCFCFQLLCRTLLWTFTYTILSGHMFSLILGIYLGVGMLYHMVILCLNFWGIADLFFKAKYVRVPISLYPHQHILVRLTHKINHHTYLYTLTVVPLLHSYTICMLCGFFISCTDPLVAMDIPGPDAQSDACSLGAIVSSRTGALWLRLPTDKWPSVNNFSLLWFLCRMIFSRF